MITAQAMVPKIITKELGMGNVGGRRKVRLSTNFLPLMGFDAGVIHSVTPLGRMEGLSVKCSPAGTQRVYQRRYVSRRNNPFETLIEIGSQSILNQAIPSYTERVHVEMRPGEIFIRPLANKTFMIRKRLREASDPFAVMVAMTGGVDVRCLADSGFSIDSILEYRPPEARDVRDLTETGALNVLANARPRLLINEDISRVDWDRIHSLMAEGPQISVLHISLQCDDFSPVKGRNLRRQAVEELTSSRDLAYDGLRMVETVRPACVVLENVPGFASAGEGLMFKSKLRKWGYHVTDGILNAGDHGGLTRRERYYLIASVFPGFAMPEPQPIQREPLWSSIEPFLVDCRDVTHTKSLQDGLCSGRARLLSRASLLSPTILKSQNRQAKDSVFIDMGDGSYRLPSLELLKYLSGIPEDFHLTNNSQEIASEIVGQSIDYPMHERLIKSLHDHIGKNVGRYTATIISNIDNA